MEPLLSGVKFVYAFVKTQNRSLSDLAPDILFSLSTYLELPDLLNFCSSSKKINNVICRKDNIWYYKLNKDFPNWRELRGASSQRINSQEQGFIKHPKTLVSITDMETPKDIYIFLYHYNILNIFKILKKKLNLDSDKIYLLKKLYKNDRRIIEIPKEIGKLFNLQLLDLNSNKIEKIPKEMGKLFNLRELDLNYNLIKEIPKEIGQLFNLQRLELSNNQIKEIPKEIGNLSNLQDLYLRSNSIKEIPKEIGNLSNLSHLSLSNNEIKEIPKEIGKLLSLHFLCLSDNEIKEIPQEINMKHCTYVIF